MNKFIIDCSSTISLFLPDEINNDYTNKLYDSFKNNACVVPSLWCYELSNVLLSSKKRNRINDNQINEIVNLIYDLPVEIENINFYYIQNNIFNIANDNNLSVYDASYLELAIRFNCSLATLDKKLIDVAKKLNVGLI
jgi:predicted nucleic acid-binding protein